MDARRRTLCPVARLVPRPREPHAGSPNWRARGLRRCDTECPRGPRGWKAGRGRAGGGAGRGAARGDRLLRQLRRRRPRPPLSPRASGPPPPARRRRTAPRLASSCARTRKGGVGGSRVGTDRGMGTLKSYWPLPALERPFGSQRSRSWRVRSIPVSGEDTPFRGAQLACAWPGMARGKIWPGDADSVTWGSQARRLVGCVASLPGKILTSLVSGSESTHTSRGILL